MSNHFHAAASIDLNGSDQFQVLSVWYLISAGFALNCAEGDDEASDFELQMQFSEYCIKHNILQEVISPFYVFPPLKKMLLSMSAGASRHTAVSRRRI